MKKNIFTRVLCGLGMPGKIIVLIISFIGVCNPQISLAQHSISGIVRDLKTGNTLFGAHILLPDLKLTGVTDQDGQFTIHGISKGFYSIRVSYMGYNTWSQQVKIQRDTTITVSLEGGALLGEEVSITAIRAQEKYPAAFSTISGKQLQMNNLGKDIPTLLQTTPSLVVSSDAGNGIGYSSMSIRGTDLTRINVTINSIPVNDAESQGVWFVDLPDLASSTTNVQIQRGVGTSTNGAGAFGASVNFLTSDLHQDPYGELDVSGGSFNTFKSTLRFGTGLMANKICLDGRLSYIHSDGYIDRAFSNLKSFYISGGYYSKNTTIRLITFSGFERTYQAWEGVPKDSLTTNRTYNPAGEYTDNNGNICYYNNQTDNYQQDNYQFHFSQQILKNWNANLALHYTKGRGYYENYKQDASFADYSLPDVIIGGETITTTNLVNRKMMDNDFYGLTFSTNYSIPEKFKITIGGAWNHYYGQHFGKIIWAEYASTGDNDRNWYYNTGVKSDFNVYTKASYQFAGKLTIFGDLQIRYVTYRMEGTLDNLRSLDQTHRFTFFNPKAGLNYAVHKKHDIFGSFGVANREPSRNNYKDADPGKFPTNETLYDLEVGYSFKDNNVTTSINGYYMNYKNQLVLTGEINNVGEAIMVNVPESYRAGVEIAAHANFFRKLLALTLQGTFSSNKIKNFTQYIDSYDSAWNASQDTVYLGTTNLSFSPELIVNGIVTVTPVKGLSISLTSKYVGKQYIDNTCSTNRMLQGYWVTGGNVDFTFKTRIINEIAVNFAVNNLFSTRYETNAWVYPYYQAGNYYEYNGYFPQALRNFLIGITLKI